MSAPYPFSIHRSTVSDNAGVGISLSASSFTPHPHPLVPDGLFVSDPESDAGLEFVALPPPTVDGSFVDWDWLGAQPALAETTYLRHVRLDAPPTSS